MSNISNVAENVSAYQNTADTKKTDSGKKVSGRTIGDVKLIRQPSTMIHLNPGSVIWILYL